MEESFNKLVSHISSCWYIIAVDTVQELHTTIQSAVKTMRSSNYPVTAIVSASELFSRFITLATFDDKTADECKKLMLHRGEMFLKKLLEARIIIAKQCAQFVTDGCVSDFPNMSMQWHIYADLSMRPITCDFVWFKYSAKDTTMSII